MIGISFSYRNFKMIRYDKSCRTQAEVAQLFREQYPDCLPITKVQLPKLKLDIET